MFSSLSLTKGAICVVEILPASRHCPENSKTHAARAKAVISRVMWGFLCCITFFNEFWLVFLLLTSESLYGHNTGKPSAPFCPVPMFKDLNNLGIKDLFSRKSLKVFVYVVIITENLQRNAQFPYADINCIYIQKGLRYIPVRQVPSN